MTNQQWDRSLCPACHCPDHDPGSCPNCPRCELHTDEAVDWVRRVEPELLNADRNSLSVMAHPGEPHEFRTKCRRCGEYGMLNVALITDNEVVRIEPRAALDRHAWAGGQDYKSKCEPCPVCGKSYADGIHPKYATALTLEATGEGSPVNRDGDRQHIAECLGEECDPREGSTYSACHCWCHDQGVALRRLRPRD